MMSGELLSNPTLTGLFGGIAVIALQLIWKRVAGTDEKSIPVQLAEINVKLAEIHTTLQLIKNDARHASETLEELKEDFWDHMNRFHNTPSSGGSGGHRSHPAPARLP